MDRLRLFLPKSHSRPLADGRRVLSDIIFVDQNALHKTLYNRWKRWGGQERLPAPEASERKTGMIGATYLTSHGTASSLRVKKEMRAA